MIVVSKALLAELQQHVEAPVLTADDDVAAYDHDFSGILRRRPAAVIRVRREEETAAVLRILYREQIPLSVRGAGYSSDAQTLTAGVVVVNEPSGRDEIRVTGDAVEVSARTRWQTLIDALRDRGRMPPVSTYSPRTSIGGTLSAGGYGAASVAFGAQVDHVRRVRMVLPSGETTWCSPTQRLDLFRSALGGMGRVGIIERVEMATIPYRPLVRVEMAEHHSLHGADFRRCFDRLDDVDYFFVESTQGVTRSCRGYRLSAAELFSPPAGNVVEPSFFAPPTAQPPLDDFAHIWCDYFVEAAALQPFLAFIECGLLDARFRRGFDRMHVLAIAPAPEGGRRAFAPTASYANERYFGVGLFYSVPRSDALGLRCVRATQRAVLDECVRLGGRPYLCGAHSLSDDAIADIFGEEYTRVERVRDALDPGETFNRLPMAVR